MLVSVVRMVDIDPPPPSAIPSGPELRVSRGPEERPRELLDLSDWSGPLGVSCLVRSARPGPLITWYVNREAAGGSNIYIRRETKNNTDGTVDVIRYCTAPLSNYSKQY